MQATNVRNLLNLRRQKVVSEIQDTRHEMRDYKLFFASLFIFITLLLPFCSNAQSKVKYQNDYDHKNLHFGFLIGVGQTRFNVRTNRTFQQPVNSILTSITSPPTTCLRIGGLMNVRLNDYFDFRILPTVSIYSRSLYLTDTSEATDDRIQFQDKAWLEIPIAIKYKSERRGNFRMYAFAGVRYGKETNAINFVNRSAIGTTLETKGSDFSLEYGIGLEAFLRYFKFTPELHFSHGLTNNASAVVFRPGEVTANQLIQRMNTNTVSFMLMFE
jgi:hypothetical protein